MKKEELNFLSLKEYQILLSLVNADLSKSYYYSNLAREIGINIRHPIFHKLMGVLQDNQILNIEMQEGTNKYLKIDYEKLVDFIIDSNLFYESYNFYKLHVLDRGRKVVYR